MRTRSLIRLILRHAFVIPVLVVSSQSPAWAQDGAVDDPTGFKFLTIGGGARAVALAETMVADGEDPFVIEYNPAGLQAVPRSTVSFAHNSFYQDSRGEYLATAIPYGKWAFGARAAYMGTDDIPRRTGPSQDPIGYYNASSALFQAAVARVVDDRLVAGVSAAYVGENIESETAESVILGIGVRYRAHRRLHIGMAFANVGPKATFVEQEIKMPILIRFGAIWELDKLSARTELVAPEDESIRAHFGGEYTPDPRLALRAGFRIGYDSQFFNAGAGVRSPDQRIGIDYAFAPYSDDLGSTHRFGLTIRP